MLKLICKDHPYSFQVPLPLWMENQATPTQSQSFLRVLGAQQLPSWEPHSPLSIFYLSLLWLSCTLPRTPGWASPHASIAPCLIRWTSLGPPCKGAVRPSSRCLQSLQSIVQTDDPALPEETTSQGLLKSHQDRMARELVLWSVRSQCTSSVRRVALQTMIYLDLVLLVSSFR